MSMIKPDKAEQRALVLRTVMEMMRSACRAYVGSEDIGPYALDLVLGMAIMVGQAEGRPMSTSDIANYTGTPRSTVLRKLKQFEERGAAKTKLVGTRRLVWLLQVNDPQVLRHVAWMLPHFSQRGSDLSKLDTKTVVGIAANVKHR